MGHDREQLVPRAHRALLAEKPPLDVDFRGAALQLVGGLEIARRPRTRAGAHLLLPQRERVTRAQALAGLRLDGLGWIAAPIHRLDDLRPEPHQPSAGQREREQTTGDVAGRERRRKVDAERSGRERPEIAPLFEPARDLPDDVGRRSAAARDGLSILHDGDPTGADQVHQCPRLSDEGREHAARGLLHRAVQRVLRRSARRARREQFAVLERGDLKRRQATDELACRSHPVRDAPRTGVVQTADESPQAIANDERDAHRRADAHVRHVLEVNGRDAAQHREAEVEWRSGVGSQGRNDPRWLLVGVEDETQPVLEIQLRACAGMSEAG